MSEINTSYRSKLYKDYYKTQASASGPANLKDKIRNDWRQFDQEILPHLPENKNIRILDLGCGYGSLLLWFHDKGYTNTFGVDISGEQVALAKEMGVGNIWEDDVMSFLNFVEEKYDLITGIDIIEHFSKPELAKLMGIVTKALNPSGTVIFRTPNMDAPFTSTFAYGDFTHECLLNASSAQQLMLSTGFTNLLVMPSHVQVQGSLKEILRKISWGLLKAFAKFALFASGKSSRGVLLTPNLVIVASTKS